MALSTLLGGTGEGQNLATKWKEKRADRKLKNQGNTATKPDGYLKGYIDNISYEITDKFGDIVNKVRNFWDNEENPNLQQVFLGQDDRYFRYGFEYSSPYSDNNYEDPTYLGFQVMIDGVNSPLFDFMKDVPIPVQSQNPIANLTSPPPTVTFGKKMQKLNTKDSDTNDNNKTYVDVLDDAGRPGYESIMLDGVTVCGPNVDIKNSVELYTKDRITYDKVFNKKENNNSVISPTPYPSPLPPVGSASYFFTKYATSDADSENRLKLLKEFQQMFMQIIPNTFPDQSKLRKVYYIQNIIGLDLLTKRMVTDYKKSDKLTFTMNEDIGMRLTYLAELYNNISYSYKYQRFAIPENCLRFDLIIKISDKRTFNLPKSQEEINNMETNDIRDMFEPSENAYIIYTLHDCLLNFQTSNPHTQQLEMGGFVQANTQQSNLVFEVFYKSVSKEFSSRLIGSVTPEKSGTYTISNKGTSLISNITDVQFPRQVRGMTGNKKNKIAGYGALDQLKNNLINITKNTLTQVGDIMIDNLRIERGKLIDKLVNKITGGDFIVEMYPANVYDMNLDEVAGDGLGNMTVKDKLGNAAMNLFSEGIREIGNTFNELTSF